MGNRYFRQILWMLAAVMLQAGCATISRHKVLSAVFNTVPSFPSREEYCREAEKKRGSLPATTPAGAAATRPAENSIHMPYAEKRCNDCHEEDKISISGLVKPVNELCFKCHPKILKHSFAHGPAAEGDCLACHLPHEASYPFLLAGDPGTLCDKCHGEKRLASAMHGKIKAKGVVCAKCHDPHSGDSKYFLR